MVKFKKTALSLVSVGLAACFTTSIAAMAVANTKNWENSASAVKGDAVTRLDASVDNRTTDYFDASVAYRLSDNVKDNEVISVILSLDTKSTLDAYLESGSEKEYSDYLKTASAKSLTKENKSARDALKRTLDKAKISYKTGVSYDTVVNGFEVLLRAKDYYKLVDAVEDKATPIVGEVYAPAQSQIVTNEVDVYDTGIFDSSSIAYQGDGVLVAVLDTGLDYTHTAFSVDNFTTDNEAYKLETIAGKVNDTEHPLSASTTTANLTAEDVYVNRKVPYAYDYADKDVDVFPLDSEHGTHVAGVIAGKDSEITGVAPNAQLAIMKVFSDSDSGARTSWLLAALEDCVKLGVDVINMSLGSGAGFTTQDDEERIEVIYNSVREAGISLITAAGNDDTAVAGSDKNGSNPLTRNPDSGVVGSPSTYEGALSVASVGGVKTPYFTFNGDIIYFTEASTSSAKPKSFVNDILKVVGQDSYDFEYVTIPGVGRRSNYSESKEFYKNKIVLVKRGETTFEEKVDTALRVMGAAGIIIYNNVSGNISMAVGADIGAVCSVSQDEGEKLAAARTGILRISKDQVAGPFMSDFSSWGPTSDLRIKPEITAHGGEIYSAVPGQAYDRLSGTSMAAPNMAGAAALIRQYVKDNKDVFGNLDPVEVTKRVNQLAMSTADIIRNKNGLVYAVRKQGAGLVNIAKATTAAAYLSTYENGVEMDKTKIELGDDKNKTGVYTMTFDINNVTGSLISYDIGSIVMTEGVSTTYTNHGDTTVTKDGYLLSPTTSIVSVTGGTNNGSVVTVPAKGSAKVTVKITLSDADKSYMDASFENGMYVEGYITLDATNGTSVDLSVPMLAFYGDWTVAPIFDEEYYDTNADELNLGLDIEDKIMEDAYATRIYGGYYSDYISTLGAYPFIQNPLNTPIAASKDHIALSNYEDDSSSALNKINSIAAGLLRNVKEWNLKIVEDSTGKEIWSTGDRNQRKSISQGITVYQSSMDVDFSVLEHNLKNNTKYTVTVEAFIDYGEHADQKNKRNTFTFPLYIDFESPIVTGVDYRTEYDQNTKKTRLFADVNIYDNHYAMAVQFGQIVEAEPNSGYRFTMNSFGKYVTPVYSSYNSTSKVTVELTDYVELIKNSTGIKFDPDTGESSVVYNKNSFIATCYDYAMNVATYELQLPDEVLAMYFKESEITLNPNETLDLTTVLEVFPADTWLQVLNFTSSNDKIVGVVNQTALAKEAGEGQSATIYATGRDADGKEITRSIKINVRDSSDPEYRKYDPPQANKASITQYHTLKAYYAISNEDRGVGITGGTYDFGEQYSLSMFPSESVELITQVDTYFPEYGMNLKFSSTRPDVVSVDEKGVVVAKARGSATVSVNVDIPYPNRTVSLFVGTVNITVKDPFTTNSIYLTSYKGLGGEVQIPGDRGITTIQSFAFSNYEMVPKDTEAGDVIDDEDPYEIKQWFIGEDTITKVVIPEGVTTIEAYAFANLSALEEVVFPSTLVRIGVGAFYDCKKLKKVNFENVKFINERAFYNCQIAEPKFDSIVAIGSYAFANNAIGQLNLPVSAQSLDSFAFLNNTSLNSVVFNAPQIKIGESVFRGCTNLLRININAVVIPARAFLGCERLSEVTLGRDVAVIGEEAFGGTNVAGFNIHIRNAVLETRDAEGNVVTGGKLIYNKNNGKLVMAAPQYGSATLVLPDTTTSVASGAFAGNASIREVIGANVTAVESYAFADCAILETINFPKLTDIGERAFFNASRLKINSNDSVNQLRLVTHVGAFAFAYTAITEVKIADGATLDEGAFSYCNELKTVKIGNNVKVGTAAFYSLANDYSYERVQDTAVFNDDRYYERYPYEVGDTTYTYFRYKFEVGVRTNLTSLEVGHNVTIGDYAFGNSAKLAMVTLGYGTKIGNYAFNNANALTSIDLSEVSEIGEGAFSGTRKQDFWLYRNYYRTAYEFEEINGEFMAVGVKVTDFAPSFASADLTNATKVGLGAFAFNQSLTSVTLNAALTEIADYMFAECSKLASVKVAGEAGDGNALPATVTKIGNYAFAATKLNQLGLENIDKIGDYAFARTPLAAVTLKDGAVIGDYAFMNCESLATVNNMGKAVEIGARAFANTLITAADLSSAEKVGDFAFSGSKVTKVEFGGELTEAADGTKKLGAKLKTLGENPFFGCKIASFAREEDVVFNGEVVGKDTLYTYDVSDAVKVIDNVLYAVVPNGLELICYPIGASAGTFTVEEGTVRIGARAFQGAQLTNVTLPSTLKAIGDKAFYECGKLTTVIFKSYNAPILEEEYDPYYVNSDNLPMSSLGYEGLGISDYYMWNASSPNNFYFGANFVGNIGKFTPSLVMVSPANGTGYNTFIFEKYFNTFALGDNAATDATLRVIAMIEALNSSITLDDEAAVAAVRRAYDALPGLEQQALVSNYSKLTNAESTIEYLKLRNQQPEIPTEPEEVSTVNALGIAGFTVAGVLLVAVAGLLAYILLEKKKTKQAISFRDFTDSSETVSEDSAEEEKSDKESDHESSDNE